MAKMSFSKAIEQRIVSAEPGSIFIARDFSDIAPDDAIRQALKRMITACVVERPLPGIYRTPGAISLHGDATFAGPNEIASTIARKFRWHMAPAGDTALHMLGIDTRVPSVFTYVSDGPYHTYSYGPFTLDFRHTVSTEILRRSTLSETVIQALRAIGKRKLGAVDLCRIGDRLSSEQLDRLYAESREAPAWISRAVERLRQMKS